MKTKVICPCCGTEIAIPENGFNALNARVIGENDNLGTITLPAKQKDRVEKMKQAGIDVSGMVSIFGEEGNAEVNKALDELFSCITKNDATAKKIKDSGFLPSSMLWPRWILAQTFQGLSYSRGFVQWVRDKGYEYQNKFLLRILNKAALCYKHRDMDAYATISRFYTPDVLYCVIVDYIKQLRKYSKYARRHGRAERCYIHIEGKNVFMSQLESRIFAPLDSFAREFKNSVHNAEKTYEMFKKFVDMTYRHNDFKMNHEFLDAYKGYGAYEAIFNLVMFHGCYVIGSDGESLYKERAMEVVDKEVFDEECDGFELHGLLKRILDNNDIDIIAKQKEWREKVSK